MNVTAEKRVVVVSPEPITEAGNSKITMVDDAKKADVPVASNDNWSARDAREAG
jgi:hypothetical protein